MATEVTMKVRLVRCPKCRLLLPEPSEVQVYRCGGCGTTLQAKHFGNGMRSRSAGLNGTGAARMNGPGGVSEDKASTSSSSNATVPDLGECSLGQIDEKDQSKSLEDTKASCSALPKSGQRDNGRDGSRSLEGTESSNSSQKAPDSEDYFLERNNERGDRKTSESIESSSSTPKDKATVSGDCSLERSSEKDESKSSEAIGSSSTSTKATAPDLVECSSEQNKERYEIESSEGIDSGCSSPKATTPCSGECFSDHNIEEHDSKSPEGDVSRSSMHKAILRLSGDWTLIENNWREADLTSVQDYSGEQIGDLNLPNEDQNSNINQNGAGDLDIEQLEVSKVTCTSPELASNENKESLPRNDETGASSEALINDENLEVTSPNAEVEIMVEIDSDSTSSSGVQPVATMESISSDILVSPPEEQSDAKVDVNTDIGSDLKSSNDVTPGGTRESVSVVTAHMEARESVSSDNLGSSPTEQLEELHDSGPNGFHHHQHSRTFETTEFMSPRSEFSTAVRDASRSPPSRSQYAYDASISSYDGMDDQFQSLHTFQDPYRAANFVQPEDRYMRDTFLEQSIVNRDSVLPNQARSYWPSMFDKNGPAMKHRNQDQNNSLPPRRPGYPPRDHAREQKDEYMSRMSSQRGFQGGYENGGYKSQMHNQFQSIPDYQSDTSARAEPNKMALLRMYYELKSQVDSLNIHASRQENHILQYRNYAVPEEELFLGLDYPRDLRRSRAGSLYSQQQSKYTRIPFSSEATTSRHTIDRHYPQNRQFSAPMPLPISCSPNGLCRIHPGQSCYAPSQWDNETVSDDQRHNSHEIKKYFGEQQQKAKRHFRPIAGGAPIVTCYNCYKPLHIPADFLLFKRKCHRLKCGACTKVLQFSLHKRIHIVPYEVNTVVPPPIEVNDQSYGAHTDPVSYSDDYGYGHSYCKSGSTEGGFAGNVAPSNSLQASTVQERNVSYGSNNPTREMQEIVRRRSQSQNKEKNPVERFLSAKASSSMLKSKNISSEVEEKAPKSSSPLHRLMGYRSPSQVIRGLSRSGSKSSARN